MEGERSNLDISLTLASKSHASFSREQGAYPRLGYHCDIGVIKDADPRDDMEPRWLACEKYAMKPKRLSH